jgi:prepilin-type N-terminal cleavage/methylation domain-containing protein
MKRVIATYARSQDGYTLVEVVITCAIGAVLMSALTSVVLTSVRAGNIATSRIEASGQIRNFEFYAYDDFAGSVIPDPSTCSVPPAPCSIALSGTRVSNSSTPAPAPYSVTYRWNGAAGTPLDRTFGGNSKHVATSVTAFSWYVDGSAPYRTVVVNLTVKVQDYRESQTFRFLPRVNP